MECLGPSNVVYTDLRCDVNIFKLGQRRVKLVCSVAALMWRMSTSARMECGCLFFQVWELLRRLRRCSLGRQFHQGLEGRFLARF